MSESTITNFGREDIDRFNNNPATPDMEKVTLYLCGLGHLARRFMEETNATDFSASTTLEPKDGGKALRVKVTVTEGA